MIIISKFHDYYDIGLGLGHDYSLKYIRESVEIDFKLGIIYGLICALLGTIFSVFNGKLYGKTSSGNIIFYEIFGGFLVISLYYVFSGNIYLVCRTIRTFDF